MMRGAAAPCGSRVSRAARLCERELEFLGIVVRVIASSRLSLIWAMGERRGVIRGSRQGSWIW